jgi:hypothetical protein
MAAALLTVAVPFIGSSAKANVITFETAPPGPGFTGPVTEDGFTYKTLSGGLLVNTSGNPGQDMEGMVVGGGGVLEITRAGPLADFSLSKLDYSAFALSGVGSQTLVVTGLLGGTVVGIDTFTLANTNIGLPKYANWTTETASKLAGVKLDELTIGLNAGVLPSVFHQNVDNVVLNPVGVPEPASLAMLAAGLIGMGIARRRRTA